MDKQHEPANVGQRAKLPDLEDFTKLGGYKKGSTKKNESFKIHFFVTQEFVLTRSE